MASDSRRRGPFGIGLGLMPSLVLLAVFGGVGLASVALIMQGQSARELVRKERQAKEEAEARLKKTQAKMAAMEKQYKTYLSNLLGERRAAEVIVLAQDRDEDGRLWTKLKFMEYGVDGNPMAPKVFTMPGDEVYFDALVMQFDAEKVEKGKAKSLYLFRRVFTDKTRPDMGGKIFEFDGEPDVPRNYEAEEVPIEAQREVWARFQRCIADKAYAEEQGVRTIFGQATYKTLRKDNIYTLKIQDNGGLILEERGMPAILREG